MRPGPLATFVGIVVNATLLAGCANDQDRPRPLDDWHRIALPTNMVPSSVGREGDWLLVGGQLVAGDQRAPALARMPTDGPEPGPEPVPVAPSTPYGQVADLVSLTGAGDTVVALGAAHGGAHANFRWTIWTGSTDRVVDRPQTFETFGGQRAGGLLGVATDGRGPLIMGTWQGEHGLDGTVWRPDDERWVRQPTVPVLANTANRQVAPRTVDQAGDGSVLVSGSVIDLGEGVRQAAAYWRDADGTWTLTELPDAGRRSEAWSTACAESCWSVGARDGSVAVWSDDRRPEVPTLEAADRDSGRALLWRDRVVVAVSSAGAGRLVIGDGDDWRAYTAPDGRVLDAELVRTQLYLVSETDESAELWMRDLTDVLSR
jgi:hypothetical protein